MARAIRVLILLVVWLGVPRHAAADWQIAPLVGFVFQVGSNFIDLDRAAENTHWNFGGAVTLIGDGPIGVEGLFIYTPSFFEQDEPGIGSLPSVDLVTGSRAYALMGNVVLATPRRWNEYGLRPFISGGVGLLRAEIDDIFDVFPVRANLLGYNVGGGAVGFLNDRVGLRFDLRYLRNLRPSDTPNTSIGRSRLSFWNAAVGVVLKY